MTIKPKMLNSKSGCGVYIVTPFVGQPRKNRNKSYYHKLIREYDRYDNLDKIRCDAGQLFTIGVPVVFGWYVLAMGLALLTANGLIV